MYVSVCSLPFFNSVRGTNICLKSICLSYIHMNTSFGLSVNSCYYKNRITMVVMATDAKLVRDFFFYLKSYGISSMHMNTSFGLC